MSLISTAVSGTPDWTWLTQGGAIGVLTYVVVALIKGWLVPGRQYVEVCAQRDKALEQVYNLAEKAARTIDALERRIGP